jgi:2,3-bisphosphoglycerate-independent phosphoglycerate mutase
MVGHTGIMSAAIQACEAVDQCVEKVTTALAHNYTTLVIADHGNCETMINPDGSPNTAHDKSSSNNSGRQRHPIDP